MQLTSKPISSLIRWEPDFFHHALALQSAASISWGIYCPCVRFRNKLDTSHTLCSVCRSDSSWTNFSTSLPHFLWSGTEEVPALHLYICQEVFQNDTWPNWWAHRVKLLKKKQRTGRPEAEHHLIIWLRTPEETKSSDLQRQPALFWGLCSE